jgi:hypothetical protein
MPAGICTVGKQRVESFERAALHRNADNGQRGVRGHALERDVLVVVALRGCGGGGEYRAGQLVGFAQSGRQRQIAHRAGCRLSFPAEPLK